MEKLGFFGGSFNPPTNVHIDIAKEIIKRGLVDKAIFVPVGDFYKKADLVPASNRFEMLKLAIENQSNLLLDDFEIKAEKNFTAKEVFSIIIEKYQKENIYFVMGSDSFLKIDTSEDYKETIDKYRFIVVQRENFKIQNTRENVIIFNPKKRYNFSSTTVRKLLRENRNVSNLINTKVYDYIKQNNLYVN